MGIVDLFNVLKEIRSFIRGSLDDKGQNVTVTHYHDDIHKGELFHYDTSTIDLDTNPIRFSFKTPPNLPELCFRINAYASGQAVLEIREAPTGGVAGGDDSIAINHNRKKTIIKSEILSSSASLEGSLTVGASAGTGGTVILTDNMGGSKNSSAGELREENEWVLDSDTTYVFSLTSSTNSIVATLILDWHERG